jgi:hypothetical protein
MSVYICIASCDYHVIYIGRLIKITNIEGTTIKRGKRGKGEELCYMIMIIDSCHGNELNQPSRSNQL